MEVTMDKGIKVPPELADDPQVDLIRERCYNIAHTIELLDDLVGMPFNTLSECYRDIVDTCRDHEIKILDGYGEEDVRNALVVRYNAEVQVLRHTLTLASEKKIGRIKYRSTT